MEELRLNFDKTTMRIMKQRKNAYMKNNNIEELEWEEYIGNIIFVFGRKKI